MRKKNILYFNIVTAILISSATVAQTGPGGVGDNTTLATWLDANSLSATTLNNASVSSWNDLSGNSNDANQATSSSQPIFKTSSLNGFPVLQFDGTNDYMDLSTNITSNATTIFTVFKRPSKSGTATELFLGNHLIHTQNNSSATFYLSPTTKYSVGHTTNTYSVFSLKTGSAASGANLTLKNGLNINSTTRTNVWNNPRSTIAARFATGTGHYFFFGGSIAEVIVYNTELNTAQYNIVNNALAGKYNLSTTPSNYTYDATYKYNIIGIGQEADGSQTTSQGLDSLTISNASDLDDGEYFMVSNDNNDFSTVGTVPAGIVERWSRSWKVSKTGNPGTVNLKFHLGSNGFSSTSNYVLLMETVDGDFSNGGTSFISGGVFNASTLTIEFQNVSIANGTYFTLAEQASDIVSIQSGSWNNTSTWSCACIPTSTDIISIEPTHEVTIDDASEVLNLTINSVGGLAFNTADTLVVKGNLIVSGSLDAGSGTIEASSSESSRSFTNSSGTQIEFNNLYVNATAPLLLASGGWSLSGSLQVSSGGLDVSSADSIVLLSTASKTSQILESMSNAFTGEFIVQRYISDRNANFGNISSPIQSATAADLDDDLFISGIGGNNGNATQSGGGTFHSLTTFDAITQSTVDLTSTADPLTPGKGYEIYLANTFTNFNATVVDFRGTPNSGSLTGSNRAIIYRNWNLLGNPYHAFINYDNITKPFAPNNFYIYNTDNGSYDFFSGASKPLIAPSQAFWVFKKAGGGHFFEFAEDDKESATTSAFVRKKKAEKIAILISSEEIPYKNTTYFEFDENATSMIDDMDAPFLASPIIEAPGIFSKATNDDLKLTNNVISMNELSHSIPLSIYAGVDANYTVELNNIEEATKYYNCAYLNDNKTGKLIDIQVENSYTFFSETGASDRFRLILSNSYEECEKLIDKKDDVSQSINSIFNLRSAYNNWYLDYTLTDDLTQIEINVFNVNGQKVLNTISFSSSNAGSYQIPDLADLKGIYIIQIKSDKEVLNRTINL